MARKKRTGKALIASMISMLLCISVLVGTTLAWFTDTAASVGNEIVTGALSVRLYMDMGENGEYEDITDSGINDGDGDIFSAANGNSTLWEPGKTEIVYLKAKNTGNLALQYSILLDLSTKDYADAFEYAVLDGMTAAIAEEKNINSWNDIKNFDGSVQVCDMTYEKLVELPSGMLKAEGAEDGKDENAFALAVHMKEDFGDDIDNVTDYFSKSVTFDLKLSATQTPYEYDSTGTNTYDENASENWINYVGNSEAIASQGKWSNGVYGTEADGNSYLIGTAAQGNNSTSIFQTVTGLTAGVTYKFTARAKWISGEVPRIYLNPRVGLSGAVGSATRVYFNEAIKGGDWYNLEMEYTVPEGYSAIQVVMWNVANANEAAEIYWDDIQILGVKGTGDLAADAFRETLAAEEAVSQKLEPMEEATEGDALYEWSEPLAGETNVVKDPTFANSEFVAAENGWSRNLTRCTTPNGDVLVQHSTEENHSVDANGADDGSGSVLITIPEGTEKTYHPFAMQFVDVVGGAEYQVSYWYKVVKSAGDTPYIKIEYWRDHETPGGTNTGQDGATPTDTKADGEWKLMHKKFTVPTNSNELGVYARVGQGSGTGETEIYIDDVQVYMTKPPTEMDFKTDQIFYYTDAEKAVFTASANIKYYPELLNSGTVDFKVYDGATLVWEKTGVTITGDASNGAATVTVPREELLDRMTLETPYCVNAIMYNAKGEIIGQDSQNIYVYERPTYIDAETNLYMEDTDGDGEGDTPFYPVLAYHVYRDNSDPELDTYEEVYAKVNREAGINLVQMGFFGDANEAIKALDAAEANGVKGLLVLYMNMKPAGADENLNYTAALLSDERLVNHPALFGYLVMDEPYLHDADPSENLENSYRFIHSFDKNHPILTVEPFADFYDDSGKYVDALIPDIYHSADSHNVYKFTKAAINAMDYDGDGEADKPVYTLLETYRTGNGRWNTADDARNNNYQALIGGIYAIGYYSVSDAWFETIDGVNVTKPMWYEGDDGTGKKVRELWDGLIEFNHKDNEDGLVFKHFLAGEGKTLTQGVDSENRYQYYSWQAKDGSIYAVILGLMTNQSAEITVPLVDGSGNAITSGEVALIAGRTDVEGAGATINTNGLTLTLHNEEAILYKINP